MIPELLNSPTDGHKITPKLSLPSTSTGAVLNTLGNVSVISNNADISGGAGIGCGWNDPIVTNPPNPCASTDILFPSVSIINIGGAWYLQLTFHSCNNLCNEWALTYSAYIDTGAANISVDCSSLPYTYNVLIHPVGIPDHSIGHYGTINPTYNYTVTADCCGLASSITGVASRSFAGSIIVSL